MGRKTATVLPSISRSPQTPTCNTNTNTIPSVHYGENVSKRQHWNGGVISMADELAENSFCNSLVKRTRRIRHLQDMKSLNDCERVFVNRKRTLMQKAKELEQSTGAMVTVTVKSQTGEVYFYANSHVAVSGLERSGLLTFNATHEMCSIPIKKPQAVLNMQGHLSTPSSFSPVQPNAVHNPVFNSDNNLTPIITGLNQNKHSNVDLLLNPTKNDTSVLDYQNANRSLKRHVASSNPINLVFEAKSSKKQMQILQNAEPSSSSDESSSSSDESSSFSDESSENEDKEDGNENSIVKQSLSVPKRLPSLLLPSEAGEIEVVKISSEDDNFNDDTLSNSSDKSFDIAESLLDTGDESPKNKLDIKFINKKVTETTSYKRSVKKKSLSSSYEGSYSSNSSSSEVDVANNKKGTTDDKVGSLLLTSEKSVLKKNYPELSKKKNSLVHYPLLQQDYKSEKEKSIQNNTVLILKPHITSPKYSPFVLPAAAKANVLKTPFKKNIKTNDFMHDSVVDFHKSLPKQNAKCQSLFTNLPTWTLPNFNRKSSLNETCDGEKWSGSNVNLNEHKCNNSNNYKNKVGDNKTFKYNYREGEDLSLYCKKYFEYHFSDEYLYTNESFSKYVLKQEKSNRGCGIMDILQQQANFKILANDLKKNMSRKMFTHFVLDALKDSKCLVSKTNYISRILPWTRKIEKKKRSLSESDYPDAKKSKIVDSTNSKPDINSMDLCRYSRKYFEYCFLDETLTKNLQFCLYVARQEDNFKSCEVLYILETFHCFSDLNNELKCSFKSEEKLLSFLRNALKQSVTISFDSEKTVKRIYPWNTTEAWKITKNDMVNHSKLTLQKKKIVKKAKKKKKNLISKSSIQTSAENKKLVSFPAQQSLASLKKKFLKVPMQSPNFITTTKLANLKKYCQEYFQYCFNSECLNKEPKFRSELIEMEENGKQFTLRHLLNEVPLFFDLKDNIKKFPMLNPEVVIEQSLSSIKWLEIRKDTKKNEIYVKRLQNKMANR